MTIELSRLIGSLSTLADSADNKDVKALAKALIKYLEEDSAIIGFRATKENKP